MFTFLYSTDRNSIINLLHIPIFPNRCYFTQFTGLSMMHLAKFKLQDYVNVHIEAHNLYKYICMYLLQSLKYYFKF